MVRALLDTNILIHREAPVVVHQSIGLIFNWLDRLGYEKWVHPASIGEIERHDDPAIRRSFRAKIASYRVMQVPAALGPEMEALSTAYDTSENDRNDTRILNELYSARVDILLTEDRGVLRKAQQLGIDDRVFTIDAFLEKVVAENPVLADYRVLSVRKLLFGDVDLSAPFFDSLRGDYPNFDQWFNRKRDEPTYVCYEGNRLAAFLYLKIEDKREPYPDLTPAFQPGRRLKIGTFKVELNGYKLGERFLKIVFDNAISQRVDEVYVTAFLGSPEQERLIGLLEDFGFRLHGEKRHSFGNESVYVRDMGPRFCAADPKLTFPYVSRRARTFLVPIYQEYHTELLPDSILRTEWPADFIEQEPHRNAIRKVYVSRSLFRDLRRGDVIIFYRTGGLHRSVVTTLGIVDNVHQNVRDEREFIRLCRKRSVFTDDQLQEQWRFGRHNRPFVVEFLYAYSFPKRPNMAALIQAGVIRDVDSAPRGFERITNEQFDTVVRLSETDTRLIVD